MTKTSPPPLSKPLLELELEPELEPELELTLLHLCLVICSSLNLKNLFEVSLTELSDIYYNTIPRIMSSEE